MEHFSSQQENLLEDNLRSLGMMSRVSQSNNLDPPGISHDFLGEENKVFDSSIIQTKRESKSQQRHYPLLPSSPQYFISPPDNPYQL